MDKNVLEILKKLKASHIFCGDWRSSCFFMMYSTKLLKHIKCKTGKGCSKLKFSLECDVSVFFTRTSVWLLQDRTLSILMQRHVTDFARSSKYSFRLALDNVTFSLLIGLKSNNFVLDSFWRKFVCSEPVFC